MSTEIPPIGHDAGAAALILVMAAVLISLPPPR